MLTSLALALVSVTAVLSQHSPNNLPGRQAMVHLFEWRWNDIAEECERFLGPKGFAGVQVSPANENVVAWHPEYNIVVERPWYERYQPVSYKLETRSGTEVEFQAMVGRCNAAGVRIYVDIVLNHMTGQWPDGTLGTAGSSFSSNSLDFGAVPYTAADFHGSDDCHTPSGNVENYFGDPNEVRNCKLGELNDLDQSRDNVRGIMIEFLNRMIGYGVAGFRVDTANHMSPTDLDVIFGSLNDLPTSQGFAPGSRAFFVQEVIYFDLESVKPDEYFGLGRITEFKYSQSIGDAFRGNNQLRWLRNFGEEWGFVPSIDAVVFINNHDNQRHENNLILTFREDKLFKMATAFMLAWPYGFPRIMSSYYWEQDMHGDADWNDWIGPPHDSNYNTLPVAINADNTCGNGWVCEHRWREVYNMVQFRNIVDGEEVTNWWDNGNNQIAFCRGGKGFIAFNGESAALTQTLQTCLPAGTYCDVISGEPENGQCTGGTVNVGSDGTANINIPGDAFDGVIAIHIESKL